MVQVYLRFRADTTYTRAKLARIFFQTETRRLASTIYHLPTELPSGYWLAPYLRST